MSERTVSTRQAYREAIVDKVDRIRIEGPLAAKTKLVLRIPQASFVLAKVSAAVAIAAFMSLPDEVVTGPATGGVSTAIRFGGGGVALGTTAAAIGAGTAWALMGVGVALGGIGAVSELRNDYKIAESGSNYVVLKRKG